MDIYLNLFTVMSLRVKLLHHALTSCQTGNIVGLFSKVAVSFHIPQKSTRVPITSHFFPVHFIVSLFDNIHPSEYEVVSHWSVDLPFPDGQ